MSASCGQIGSKQSFLQLMLRLRLVGINSYFCTEFIVKVAALFFQLAERGISFPGRGKAESTDQFGDVRHLADR